MIKHIGAILREGPRRQAPALAQTATAEHYAADLLDAVNAQISGDIDGAARILAVVEERKRLVARQHFETARRAKRRDDLWEPLQRQWAQNRSKRAGTLPVREPTQGELYQCDYDAWRE